MTSNLQFVWGWFDRRLMVPKERIMVRVWGAILFAVGMGFLGHTAAVIPGRLAPFTAPFTFLAGEPDCKKAAFSGSYLLATKGHTHVCTGGDYVCGIHATALVTYDLQNPEHCRVSNRVGQLSRLEWAELIWGIVGLCAGLGSMGMWLSTDINSPRWPRRLIIASITILPLAAFLLLSIFDTWRVPKSEKLRHISPLDGILGPP